MPLSSPALRRFVRHALVAATGAATPDANQLARAFDLLYGRLRTRLSPIFGPAPIAALFARARDVAAAEFPWLPDVVPKDGEACPPDGPERQNPALETHVLAEGLAAVLAQSIALMRTFIGDDFIMPLVQDAWETASLGDAPVTGEGDHE